MFGRLFGMKSCTAEQSNFAR